MTRAVLGGRWWVREELNSTLGLGYPNVCNTVGALAWTSAPVAAWRRRPAGTAVGTAQAAGLKLWWRGVIVRRSDARAG